MEKFLMCIAVNVLMLIIWFIIHLVRKSDKDDAKMWDNGYEFYSTLKESDKKQYWKDDSKLIDQFFMVLFVLIEITLITYVVYPERLYWFVVLLISLVISIGFFIIKSFKLQRKYK